MGVTTIGFAGGTGGRMAKAGLDHCLVVPSDSIHRVQECHVAIYHILWDLVHTLLADDRGRPAKRRMSSMQFVDEFRDPGKASSLLRAIEDLTKTLTARRDLPLHIMEVCGGHTHSIFRYGIQDAAEGDRIRAWARLSRLRLADGPCRRLRGDCRNTGRYLHDIRRRNARARIKKEPFASQSRRRRRAHGLFAARCLGPSARKSRTARLSSSASVSRRRCLRPLLPCCRRNWKA